MGISNICNHIQIKVKMPNLSQKPAASSKAPYEDLKDMDVLCTFKIKIQPKFGSWVCQRPGTMGRYSWNLVIFLPLLFESNVLKIFNLCHPPNWKNSLLLHFYEEILDNFWKMCEIPFFCHPKVIFLPYPPRDLIFQEYTPMFILLLKIHKIKCSVFQLSARWFWFLIHKVHFL